MLPDAMTIPVTLDYGLAMSAGLGDRGGLTDEELDRWAAKIQTWQKGGTPTDGRTVAPTAPRKRRDVYVYFKHEEEGKGPEMAKRFLELGR